MYQDLRIQMLRKLALPLSSASLLFANRVKELSSPRHCQHPSTPVPGNFPFNCAR